MKAVYFVMPQKDQILPALATKRPHWTVLKDHAFPTGPECWVLKTWYMLAQQELSFTPLLVDRAVAGEVCVFHYDHAKPKHGVHSCFAVVARADRPAPPLADMTVVQNRYLQGGNSRYIPHWPQNGLIPRSPSRGTRIESMAFMGDQKYVPAFYSSPSFLSSMQQLGVSPIWRAADAWHDYHDVDIVLAFRCLPPVVEKTKPALKLVNAWLAGAPMILRPEAAYTEIRQSPLDYLEAWDEEQVLEGIRHLKNSPTLYADMVAHGKERAKEFTEAAISKAWVALLEESLKKNASTSKRARWAGAMVYQINKMHTHIWKRCRGWRD